MCLRCDLRVAETARRQARGSYPRRQPSRLPTLVSRSPGALAEAHDLAVLPNGLSGLRLDVAHAERRIRVALAVFERRRDPPKSAPDFDAPVSLSQTDVGLDHAPECADLRQRDRHRTTRSESWADHCPAALPLLACPSGLGGPLLSLPILCEGRGEGAFGNSVRALFLSDALRLPIIVSRARSPTLQVHRRHMASGARPERACGRSAASSPYRASRHSTEASPYPSSCAPKARLEVIRRSGRRGHGPRKSERFCRWRQFPPATRKAQPSLHLELRARSATE